MSKKKAHAISNGIFLISLGILILTNAWWPGMILAIWASMASRQYLTGRIYYAMLTTIVLLGLFFVSWFRFDYDLLAPVLLVIGGIYLITKEYFFEEDTNGEDKPQQLLEDAEIDEQE